MFICSQNNSARKDLLIGSVIEYLSKFSDDKLHNTKRSFHDLEKSYYQHIVIRPVLPKVLGILTYKDYHN